MSLKAYRLATVTIVMAARHKKDVTRREPRTPRSGQRAEKTAAGRPI